MRDNPGRMAGKGKGTSRRLVIILIIALICITVIGVIVGLLISNGIKENSNSANCRNSACTRFSSFIQNIINTSVTPCEDFYTFSCGRFAQVYPNRGEKAIYNITTISDTPKFHEMLIKKTTAHFNYPKSAIRKMQDLYRTCLNRFENDNVGGEPLLKMISAIGGWELLGTWDESKFNINKLLKQVHVDYRTSILFDIFYKENRESTHYTIQIGRFDTFQRPEGKRLQLLPLLHHILAYDKHKEDTFIETYRKFMFNITMLLVRDAKVNITDIVKQKIKEYVEDVITFAYSLLKNSKGELRFSQAISPTFLKFPNIVNRAPLINWTDLFMSKYPNVTIQTYTLIQAENLDFLSYINDVLREPAKTFLHNYFVWELIAENSIDLDEEYFNENNITAHLLGISLDTLGLDRNTYCIYPIAKTHLIHPFRYLYMKTYIDDNVVEEVKELIPLFLEQFLNISESTPWITRTLDLKWDAKNRLDSINIIGITTPLPLLSEMDNFYDSFNAQGTNYLSNRIQLRKIESLNPPETWKIPCYPHYHFFYGLQIEDSICSNARLMENTWFIPEQIFQFPFYEFHYPTYIKYANLGFDLARKFVNYFIALKASKRPAEQIICLEDNIKKEDFKIQLNKEEFPFKARISEYTDHLSESLAIKLIYEIFKNWTKSHSKEKLPPNFPVQTQEQAFFFALQTSLCESRTVADLFAFASNGMTSRLRWYLDFSQVPDFKENFNCTFGMRMHPMMWCLTLI